jgi:hypothetical protein
LASTTKEPELDPAQENSRRATRILNAGVSRIFAKSSQSDSSQVAIAGHTRLLLHRQDNIKSIPATTQPQLVATRVGLPNALRSGMSPLMSPIRPSTTIVQRQPTKVPIAPVSPRHASQSHRFYQRRLIPADDWSINRSAFSHKQEKRLGPLIARRVAEDTKKTQLMQEEVQWKLGRQLRLRM